jgi:hypothetical protein
MAKFGTSQGTSPQFNGGSLTDQRQFLVQCSILYGTWAMTSGGDVSYATSKEYDGGSVRPYIIAANPLITDLVLTRNYNWQRDGSMIAALQAQFNVGAFDGLKCTVTQVPTSGDLAAQTGAKAQTWFGYLTGCTGPKMDTTKTGASPAVVSVTIACTSVL